MHILLVWALARETTLLLLLGADLLALASIPSVLLRRRGRPTAAMGWILAMIALPYVGVILWWVFGRVHLERKRRKRRAATIDYSTRGGRLQSADGEACERFSGLIPHRAMETRLPIGAVGLTLGNRVTPLVDGALAFDEMLGDIRTAERSILAQFYIWRADPTGEAWVEALIERALAGVRVRVLVDAWGSPDFMTRFSDSLRGAGARVETFLPPGVWPWALNFRNHRKLLVIDETRAYTGGMNVADEYAGDWHDLMIRVEGPAASELLEVGLDDWYFASGEHLEPEQPTPDGRGGDSAIAVIASGPDDPATTLHDSFFMMLGAARKRCWLTTPYFIPSVTILTAVRAASERGVDVRLLVPARSDVMLVRLAARAHYRALLDAGVRIFEYQPRILHLKALLVDDELALVGSPNVDLRSFRLNFELACMIRCRRLNGSLAGMFQADLADSEEILSPPHTSKTWWRLVEALAELFSPLF